MKQEFGSGDLVHIDHNKTVFWRNNSENKPHPNFDNPLIFDKSFTGIIIQSNYTKVYSQVLFDQNIFWVDSRSLSLVK